MNAPSEDIKDYLEAYGESSGLGLDYASTLFIGKEPSTPIVCATIFDTAGFAPQLILDGDEADVYEYPSIQIRVRHNKYLDGWELLQSIVIALHGVNHTTVNGTLYTLIQCVSGPTLLDWDENGRARFIANFNIQRTV